MAPLPNGLTWRKSTYSNPTGDCVEIADHRDGARTLRDSKNPEGPTLTFTPSEWAAFLAGAKAGEFG